MQSEDSQKQTLKKGGVGDVTHGPLWIVVLFYVVGIGFSAGLSFYVDKSVRADASRVIRVLLFGYALVAVYSVYRIVKAYKE